MKKFFLGIFTLCILSSAVSFAYNPSTGDQQQVNLLNLQLDSITTGDMKDVWNFYSQIKVLVNQFSGDEKLSRMLNQLNTRLINRLTTEKNKAKLASKQFKSDFVDQYLTGEVQDIPDQLSCTGRYNTLDNISFAYNFPTALTVATRYREVNCGYYLPANGNGPFQILSKNYGTGTINEETFTKSVQDFIEFSKAKYLQYKTKLGINLTYTGFDRTGLENHAGLYNGGLISGNIVNANNPHYLRDGYGVDFSGALRYGLMPKFLKTLQWEVASQY